MLAVSIKVFYGDAETIVRENSSLLQDTPLSLRLGFPDVVFPGDVRNELYTKLWSGDFSASQSTNARRNVANFARGQVGAVTGNVQVSMEVRDQTAGQSSVSFLSAAASRRSRSSIPWCSNAQRSLTSANSSS